MDKTYYTVNPDGDVLMWWPGSVPSLAAGPENLTMSCGGYRLQGELVQGTAVFVPWEVVLIASQ